MASFTVLLSVYKNELPNYLNDSLVSIWDNQKLKPDQIVLVQDGSLTLELEEIIAEWKNKLNEILTLVFLERNIGLALALNEGLKECKYELVARMDTDDIAMPDRFEKQVFFMLKNPEIMASSAQIEEWNIQLTEKLGQRNLPLEPNAIRLFAKRRSPLSHPVTIFRKSAILKVGGYPPLRKAQDYALWALLLVNDYQLANLSDTLLKMRTGNELLDRRGWSYFKQELQLLNFQKKIGFLSEFDYITNVISRAILRLAPNFIKNIIYRVAR